MAAATVYGAALGALLLTTIGSALAVLRIDPFWQQAVVGALILAAIGLDRALAVRLTAGCRTEGPRCEVDPTGGRRRTRPTSPRVALAALGSWDAVVVIALLAVVLVAQRSGGRLRQRPQRLASCCWTSCRSRSSRCR